METTCFVLPASVILILVSHAAVPCCQQQVGYPRRIDWNSSSNTAPPMLPRMRHANSESKHSKVLDGMILIDRPFSVPFFRSRELRALSFFFDRVILIDRRPPLQCSGSAWTTVQRSPPINNEQCAAMHAPPPSIEGGRPSKSVGRTRQI